MRQYDDQVVLLIPGGRTGLDADRREQFAQLWVRACNEVDAWKAAQLEPERKPPQPNFVDEALYGERTGRELAAIRAAAHERPSHEVLSEAKAAGKCPLHGKELLYDPDMEVQASGDWQEHHICPSEGCEIGAWYG